MNIFQTLVHQAVANGVAEQTIVMFLLLPLVASIIAAARHIVGFRAFGLFIPTAMALAFGAMGIWPGLFLFAVILLVAHLARRLLRRVKIHYLPRMALLLWLISVSALALIFLSPIIGWKQLTTLSIFPVLVLILLAEEFIAVQIGKSFYEASRITLETIGMAIVGYFIFSLKPLQSLAISQPQWVIFAPLVLNLLVGRFTGLRFLEYHRFRKLK